MESSRRAVESYWRSRMIDAATSEEDKVTPVYKLEEICDLLRSSHVSIVKEVAEFIFKRLQHKNPIVKQKTLRLIKYSVGKSGVEFRREMQRNSVAVRQLIHHKGQPDPLKGDALNKSVRDTAQEALSAIFASEENGGKAPASTTEPLAQRIQGFGNTNFDMPAHEEKKSILSEMVDIGTATIKHGLNTFTQSQSHTTNDTGSYKSPNLRRSLTTEIDYDGVEYYDHSRGEDDHQPSSRFSKNVATGPWGQDIKTKEGDSTNGNLSSSNSDTKTREERLLETIVTSGGVRLQPTRDTLQAFLVEASKLNPMALCYALESKLHSHLWQVRMKSVCVLEAILRKREDEHFSVINSYFSENKDAVVKCSESPQASLREKANKVLSLLDGEVSGQPERSVKTQTTPIEMPDLIDTNDPLGDEGSVSLQGLESITAPHTSTISLVDDLFYKYSTNSEVINNDDPFADVSFHPQNKEESDLFSGMDTVDKSSTVEPKSAASQSRPELFDIFGSSSDFSGTQEKTEKDVNILMGGLSIDKNDPFTQSEPSTANANQQVSNNAFQGILGVQSAGVTANPVFPIDPMAYNALSSGLMFNSMAFPSQPINYGSMGSLYAQQQFLSTMSNLHQMTNLHTQNIGANHASGTQMGGYPSPLPDIFNPSIPTQTPSPLMNNSKKEETRAFDFISDHIAAARDPKRVN